MSLLLLVSLAFGSGGAVAQPDEAAVAEWEELDQKAVAAYDDGDYAAGLDWAQKAYDLARRAFGPRDPNTLVSLNNLALLYAHQGRYGEAEPLFQRALQLSREALGEAHPNTLVSLHNLALPGHFLG